MPTVLVVEDELLIRMHVADLFRDFGLDVLEAGDAAEALRILQASRPVHAVFSDITLPGQPDGFGLAQWIRQRLPGLPVVLTSGKVNDDHAREAGAAGPFFPKPCDYTEVASRIRSLIEKAEQG